MGKKAASLLEAMKARIAEGGPMRVADYMALALSDPDFGYYMQSDPFGVQGDFVTAPEISQIFGELVGLWLAETWRVMGKPEAVLVELGPGRGTLMADLLRATASIDGFHNAVSVHLVETSPALQKKQAEALAGKHPTIAWHASFETIPAKPLLLVANEFFDALPIRQFVYTESGWQERMVGLEAKGALQFVLAPQPLPEAIKNRPAAANQCREYSQAAHDIARLLCAHIDREGGAALIIDYGHDGASGDTLQAVRAHKYHDPLADPGTADLTAHVDFSLLRQCAKAHRLAAHGPAPQGLFLSALGAQARAAALCQNAKDEQKAAIISGLNRLVSLEQMGDLFKVFCITTPEHPKPEGF